MILLPRIGLGCFPLSLEAVSDKDALETITAAYEAGYRLFNTANTYGRSRSEILLGKALLGKRNDAIIITKGGFSKNYHHLGKPSKIIKSCEESLKRLGTDYLDIYELHSPDPGLPVEESMQAFVRLRKEGKIRFAGISRATLDEIIRANRVIDLLTVELEYSIRVKEVEQGIIPWCEQKQKYLLAYIPLGRGYLTGRGYPETAGLKPENMLYQHEELEKTLKGMKKLSPIANHLGCSLAQLSLAYLLNKSQKVIPIPGATKPWQVKENYEAIKIRLNKEQMWLIERVFN